MLGTGLVMAGSMLCQKRLFLGSSSHDLEMREWGFGVVVRESEDGLYHCLMVLVWGSPYPGRLPTRPTYLALRKVI